MNDKSSLRIHFLGLLKKQGSRERQEKSLKVAEQLLALPVYQKAKTVLFYASMPGEVETFAMITQAIQHHKRVALPLIASNQGNMVPTLIDSLEGLQSGPFGTRQPHADASKALDVAAIDAVIVPGLAFDLCHNRLGRGAGFYDRFLASLPDSTSKVGLAFDFQVVDRLPTEKHDVSLDYVIAG